ncbi:MAG: heavy metal sensor histidine kinase [Verrucomicrobia bacterium]|nr:heavy metal sensor histidine kinase [Verrucomicrobiota bacterium]
MCSKNVPSESGETAKRRIGETATLSVSPSRRFPVSWRTLSITRRLTLLYAASTAALLLLAGGFLYWTLKSSLEQTRHGLLASKIEVLRLLLREQPEKAQALASEVEHEAGEGHPLKYYLRILDEQDRVLLETPGLEKLIPAELFPPPVEVTAGPLKDVQQKRQAGRSFLLMSVRAPTGTAGREQRTLQIAVDVSAGAALLTNYRNKLLIVLVAGTLFAAVAGGWVARQGMRPLADITKAAQHITASQLHERIAGTQWPRELAELAAAFDAMLDRLEDSFTRLSQFSADLAHELRTPINNLRGEAEVALARSRTAEEYQHILASSLEEHERLSRMIDGLLFLARADNPKAAVERVRFDARKEIEAVREFYEALAGEQDVAVTCEGNAWVTGDPMLFRRAVSNLLANALKHTPAQGRVRVALRPLDDQAVELCVRDSGAGIAPEHLPKIFDRFYRAGHSGAPAAGGAGLGLAIVQSIMRLHGGSASVQSQVGQGTTFTLRFPAGLPPSPAGKMTKM